MGYPRRDLFDLLFDTIAGSNTLSGSCGLEKLQAGHGRVALDELFQHREELGEYSFFSFLVQP